MISYLQRQSKIVKQLILYSAVGILAFILFFLWLQKAGKTFSNLNVSESLQLESLKQEIQSGLESVKESTRSFKGILEESKDELQKIEGALKQLEETAEATRPLEQQTTAEGQSKQ